MCEKRFKEYNLSEGYMLDRYSCLSPDDNVCIQHISFDIKINFDLKQLTFRSTYLFKKSSNNTCLLLDIYSCIQISSISYNEKPLEFSILYNSVTNLYALKIEIGYVPNSFSLAFSYITSSDSNTKCLQWLPSHQTESKRYPFMFSQCQFINARELFPCYDSPLSRFSFDATVSIPQELKITVLMSGMLKAVSHINNNTVFSFYQKNKIPSYLFGIAAGELQRYDLSNRCAIWCEPAYLNTAVHELSETETLLQAAEQMFGEYKWERYDQLILPSIYPYGGMENPGLVMLSNKILGSNKSSIGLIAHEMAHSWFGNTVTNNSWDSLWLNEGFAVYAEQKILQSSGFEDFMTLRADYSHMEFIDNVDKMCKQGLKEKTILDKSLSTFDDLTSHWYIPYCKGSYLLNYLEKCVGGKDVFISFLKDYINAFEFKAVTSNQFISYFEFKFPSLKVNWNAWLHSTGIENFHVNLWSHSVRLSVEALADHWYQTCVLENRTSGIKSLPKVPSYCEGHCLAIFLDRIIHLNNISKTICKSTADNLDNIFGFSHSTFYAIKFKWIVFLITANLSAESRTIIQDFFKKPGPAVCLFSVIEKMCKSVAGRKMAIELVNDNIELYHVITVNAIKSLIENAME